MVLVPTMGALHAGHVALIRRARRVAGDGGTVVVSIYVNPAQFGEGEDLGRYPRPVGEDRRMCREEGVDVLFQPGAGGLYDVDHSVWVDEERLAAGLCGAARPGHFRGVCTVVAKLFHLVGPDAAVFGRKDYQQLAVVRRMTRDLDWPVRIIAAPTVRDRDGLALSSRNRYLDDAGRVEALGLRRGLLAAREAWRRGERDPERLAGVARAGINRAPTATIDYVEVVDGATLETPERVGAGCVALAAAWIRGVRLIDNLEMR